MVYKNRGTGMLVVMRHDAGQNEIGEVVAVIEAMGYDARPVPGTKRTVIGVVGNDGRIDSARIESLAGVLRVIHITPAYTLVSRELRRDSTIVTIGSGVQVGGGHVAVIAG